MRQVNYLSLKTIARFIFSDNGIKCLIAAFIFLHILRSTLLFPTFAAITDPNPIFTDDYSYHFYYSLLGSSLLKQQHTTWGFDPYFMAGYPKTILSDPSNKITEILIALFFFISPAVVFKLTILLTIAVVPILVYCACRNMELTPGQSALGVLVGTTYWWWGMPQEKVLSGLFSFSCAAYVCPFIYSAFYRFFLRREFSVGMLIVIAVPLTFLLHPTTAVILMVPLLLLYFASWGRLSTPIHSTVGLTVVLTVVVNWFWIKPLLTLYHYKTASSQFLQSSGLGGMLSDYFIKDQTIELLLLVFGVLGLYLWRLSKERLKYISLGGTVIFLLLLSYFGNMFTGTADLQPQRFRIPLNAFLALPAAFGIWWSFTVIKDNYAKKDMVVVISLIVLLLVPSFASKMYAITFGFLDGAYGRPLVTSMHPGNEALVKWILENTTKEGRILIEDSGFLDTQGKDISVWGHQFYLTHFPALLPYYTKREFIGGPYPYSLIRHHFAEFHDGILFKRPLDTFTLPELQSYFDLYNIKWIICWSKKSKEYFNRYPDYLLKNNTINRFYTYTVHRKPSFFYKGEGKVTSNYNQLQLTEVKSDGEIIIKYHWLEQLRTDPPRSLERVMLMDDPIGFIKINDPPSSIVVYNGY